MTLRSYDQQLPVEGKVEAVWPDVPASARLAEIDVPTLVVVGTEDVQDIEAIADKLVAEIPGARLAKIEGAGHLPSLERPDELNALLLDVPSLRTASESAGQAAAAHGPNDSFASAAQTSCRSGSIQRNVAVPGLEPK